MLQWISRSFKERSVAASIPSRSATPVPKLSIATSAELASACTISRPFSVFMSTAMLRLFRLALRKTVPRPGAGNGGQPRVSSPWPTVSTLMMSAPRSPRYWAHKGPARTFERSRTRMPVRGFDTAKVLAGPLCAQYLGDLGADIIKVETVGQGDETRGWPPFPAPGLGTVFLSANRNKRSIAVDMKTEKGREIVHALASSADVAIESFGTGVAERLGIDAATLRSLNKRLIHCSISGFG